ncbi:MAG: AmmeMemoRadiSam system protein B [Spirochaetales bacterium]|nr:AmmeMemoRadiSam system protein B [Spirochaetales bacterium]
MSTVRKRALPAGWYPQSAKETRAVLEEWERSSRPGCSGAVACVVPHAGWDFSGELAFSAIRCLDAAVDTVVVVGGHLPPVRSLLISTADLYETPLGSIEGNRRLIEALSGAFHFDEDRKADNTVEIQLPIVKYLFPAAKIVYMRVSPTREADSVGRKLKYLSVGLNTKIAVIGSTDLTHYGPSYGFTPAGSGDGAARWVREENDKPFLDFLLRLDGNGAMRHAGSHSSACSAGAAAAAAGFAAESGVERGTLLGYRMSRDRYMAESFVGYGAVVYVP